METPEVTKLTEQWKKYKEVKRHLKKSFRIIRHECDVCTHTKKCENCRNKMIFEQILDASGNIRARMFDIECEMTACVNSQIEAEGMLLNKTSGENSPL